MLYIYTVVVLVQFSRCGGQQSAKLLHGMPLIGRDAYSARQLLLLLLRVMKVTLVASRLASCTDLLVYNNTLLCLLPHRAEALSDAFV